MTRAAEARAYLCRLALLTAKSVRAPIRMVLVGLRDRIAEVWRGGRYCDVGERGVVGVEDW